MNMWQDSSFPKLYLKSSPSLSLSKQRTILILTTLGFNQNLIQKLVLRLGPRSFEAYKLKKTNGQRVA